MQYSYNNQVCRCHTIQQSNILKKENEKPKSQKKTKNQGHNCEESKVVIEEALLYKVWDLFQINYVFFKCLPNRYVRKLHHITNYHQIYLFTTDLHSDASQLASYHIQCYLKKLRGSSQLLTIVFAMMLLLVTHEFMCTAGKGTTQLQVPLLSKSIRTPLHARATVDQI